MSDNVIPLVPRVHYLVALGYIILDRPGTKDDEHYVEIIGSYEEMEDAKLAVEANAGLIADNDEQYLTIYKIDLNQCKVYDFHRKDIPEAVERAYKKMQEGEALKKKKLQTDGPQKSHYAENVILKKTDTQGAPLKAPKTTTVDFPRPNKGLLEQTSTTSATSTLLPTVVIPKPKKMK